MKLPSFLKPQATQFLDELILIRVSLQRIAGALEAKGQPSGTGIRSWYDGGHPEAGAVLWQSDEDLARLEELERRKEREGGAVGLDEDLTGDEE